MAKKLYDEEKLKKAQEASLKILLEIDRICKKHGINYMLDSGTLLGAVRHKGFIPWDDDADIAMTRENFRRFRDVAESELDPGMQLIMPDEYRSGKAFYDFTPRIIYLNSKRHCDSEETEFYEGKLNHLWVDIFIQDNIPDNKAADKATRLLQKIIYGMSMAHRYDIDFDKYTASDRARVRLLAAAGKLIKMKTLFSWQECLSVKHKPGKNMYYSNYQPDFMHDTVKREWSENPSEVLFEGHMLMAPGDPDGVLKVIYGDYMTPPPEEKRVPSHSDDIEVD